MRSEKGASSNENIAIGDLLRGGIKNPDPLQHLQQRHKLCDREVPKCQNIKM